MPRSRLDRLLHPRSIAVVGATERPGYAQRLLRNLIDGGFGGVIHPVSRSRDKVFDRPAVVSLGHIEGPVDVAVIVVPAPAVPDVIRDCGRRDVGAAVVISSGFGEAGAEGRQRREELRAAAAETGMLVVGPNGNGYASASADLWATTFSGLRPNRRPPVLPAALLSQSGGTAFGAGHERAQDLGFTFDTIVSTGNEEVTTSEQLAEMLLAGDTEVVAMVCEELHDGPALLRAAQVARDRGRAIVILKIGRSEAGRAAAATHTAALAGDDAVIDGVLRQHGIVRVDDVDELVQAVRYLATARRPTGRRAVVLSHSGGLGALAADALGSNGFELPELTDVTRGRLDRLLGDTGGRGNPVDITMALRAPVVSDVIAELAATDIDLLQVVTAGDTDLPARIAAGLEPVAGAVPTHLVWASGLRDLEDPTALDTSTVPWFTGAGIAAKVLGRIHGATGFPAPMPSGPAQVIRDSTAIDEVTGKDQLAALGVPVPPSVVVDDPRDLLAREWQIPLPWALKISSPEVFHKASSGLLALGLDERSLPDAIGRLDAAATALGLRSRRWLLEHQVDVRAELYVGCTIDPHLGPVIGVGPGGGDVELVRHVVWATCPMGEADARALVDRDEQLRRWCTFRGVEPEHLDAVAAAMASISRWFVDEAGPQELEINPLAVTNDGRILALDAVIHMPADARIESRHG